MAGERGVNLRVALRAIGNAATRALEACSQRLAAATDAAKVHSTLLSCNSKLEPR